MPARERADEGEVRVRVMVRVRVRLRVRVRVRVRVRACLRESVSVVARGVSVGHVDVRAEREADAGCSNGGSTMDVSSGAETVVPSSLGCRPPPLTAYSAYKCHGTVAKAKAAVESTVATPATARQAASETRRETER
jgi:hypothetical protein